MPKCTVCGKQSPFIYNCKSCGKSYCAHHRLPEDHDCKKLDEIRKVPVQKSIESPEIENMFVIVNGKEIKVKKLSSDALKLDLSNQKIKAIQNIKGLDELTDLTYLKLKRNEIREINGLESLRKLRVLDLSWNEIEKIEGLNSLKDLRYLDLSWNLIKKIEGLNQLPNIEALGIRNNQIKDLDGLQRLSNLRYLSIAGNPIRDYTLLEKMKWVYIINFLRDIEELIKTGNLKSLFKKKRRDTRDHHYS